MGLSLVLLLGLATTAFGQTTTTDRVRALERVVIGTNTFGTTSPLQIVGLPAKTSQTDCAWLDANGNVFRGACGGFADQSANLVFAGPSSGGAAAPTFRALTDLDVPDNLTLGTVGGTPTFSSNVTVSGTLGVTGATTLSGALDARGAITNAGSANGGYVLIDDRLRVTNALDFQAAIENSSSVNSGQVYINDTLIVNGATDFRSSLSNGGALNSGAVHVNDALTVTGVATFSGTVQASGWASRASGWGVTSGGSADFRDLFSDELRAKSFTTELTQAVNGSMLWTKSVSEVAGEGTVGGAVTCPTAGGATETWWFRDAVGGANLRIFQTGDAVLVRVLSWADAGGDGASELSVSDCIVAVSGYADGTSGNDGYQSWTVTRPASGGGAMANGGAIPLRTQALNFGASGDGFLEATVSDGANNANAPYFGVATWATTPAAANRTARARYGQLRGLTSTDEYGVLAGAYSATDGRFFRASDQNFDLHGIDLTIWDGSSQAFLLRRNAGAPFFSMGNPAPTAYASGTGVWFGDDGGVYKARIGNPSGDRLTWDGSTLSVVGNGSGLTSISGSNITTGSITANQLATGALLVGKNLLRNASLDIDADANSVPDGYGTYGAMTSVQVLDGGLLGKYWRLNFNTSGAKGIVWQTSQALALGTSSWVAGTPYYLSVWLRSYSLSETRRPVWTTNGIGTGGSVEACDSNGQNCVSAAGWTEYPAVHPAITSTWQRYVWKVIPGSTWTQDLYVFVNMAGAGGAALDVDAVQFEQINGASSVSPWGVSAFLANGDIDGRTITGATVRTAASGARVEMNATNLRSIDSGGNTLLQVDGTGIQVNQAEGGVIDGSRGFRFASNAGMFGYRNSGSTKGYVNVQAGQLANNYVQVGASSSSGATGGFSVDTNGTSVTTRMYANPYGGTGTIQLEGTVLQSFRGLYPGYSTGSYQSTYHLYRSSTIATGLAINGDLELAGIYKTGGAWLANGGTTTLCDNSGWIYRCNASSRRYKTHIVPAPLDRRVLDLQPVRFDYREPNPVTGEPLPRSLGLIAEDVDALGLRDLVTYQDGQPEAVQYDKLALYLLEVIKDQQRRIEALEAKLKE